MKNRPTHCIHGHAFDEQNTYTRPNGSWSCKQCCADRTRKYYETKSAAYRKRRDEEITAWLPKVSDVELAWTAGLFEGEGTVTIATGGHARKYTRLVVTLSSTDFEMIAFLQNRWSGNIRTYQPKTKSQKAKAAQSWTIGNRRAEGFLKQVLPFIRTRRVRAKFELGIQVQSTKKKGTRLNSTVYREAQEAYRLQMKALNKRGI